MSAATAHIPEPLVERRLPPDPLACGFIFLCFGFQKTGCAFWGAWQKTTRHFVFPSAQCSDLLHQRPEYIESVWFPAYPIF